MGTAVRVTEFDAGLDAVVTDEVLALAHAAEQTDGVAPLSEAFLLRLRRDGAGTVHLTTREDTTLIGYAQWHSGGSEAELVVHPAYRHRGVGRALLTALLRRADTGRDTRGPDSSIRLPAGDPGPRSLRMWAHGDHPSATALGHPAGFERYRVLWQLRRDLAGPVAEPALPAGVRLRAFVPGADEDAWLRVNARAFADHPDQGRWTAEDLALREAEPWFDPAGFLLAVDADETILGFHWTKVHHDQAPPVGEVYVLGVDPRAQGTGLGAALTTAGLRHLHGRGLRQVLLYVDEDNPRAVALYRKLGFVQWVTDVAFHRVPR